MSVDIGVPAFLPYSQIDLRPVKDLDALIGQVFAFKVLKFNRKRNNVVISRRVILEKKHSTLREQMRNTLQEGQIIRGAITNIIDYGLFIKTAFRRRKESTRRVLFFPPRPAARSGSA